MQHSISERILKVCPLVFLVYSVRTKIQSFSLYNISIDNTSQLFAKLLKYRFILLHDKQNFNGKVTKIVKAIILPKIDI